MTSLNVIMVYVVVSIASNLIYWPQFPAQSRNGLQRTQLAFTCLTGEDCFAVSSERVLFPC